jgi:hypothetical protein
MPSWIDGSLYPDVEVPESLDTIEEKIDFIARLCGAWDFGILPEPETAAEIKKPEWRETIEETRMLSSLAYHLLRAWHDLAELQYLGTFPAEIRDDPQLDFV